MLCNLMTGHMESYDYEVGGYVLFYSLGLLLSTRSHELGLPKSHSLIVSAQLFVLRAPEQSSPRVSMWLMDQF